MRPDLWPLARWLAADERRCWYVLAFVLLAYGLAGALDQPLP